MYMYMSNVRSLYHLYMSPHVSYMSLGHDDVIKWEHFLRYWPFVRGIHRSPVHSPHKGQWRGASIFSLICARINDWTNNREAGDLRRHRAHYDVTVMWSDIYGICQSCSQPKPKSVAGLMFFITLTSQWAQWRLKSPASRLFTQPFIQIKESIKAPRHWPLCGEFTGDR